MTREVEDERALLIGGGATGATATHRDGAANSSAVEHLHSTAVGVELESTVMSVDAVVNMLDWGPFHWLLLLQCGLSWACDATEMMLSLLLL